MSLAAFDLSPIKLLPFARTFKDQWGNNEPWMTDYERAVLISVLWHIKANCVVEIGCNEGFCAFDVLLHSTVQCYVGVDLAEAYKPPKIHAQHREIPGPKAGRMVRNNPRFMLETRYRGSLDMTPEDLPWADAVIVDGDHSYEAAKHDTWLATTITKPGGAILWHDYAFWDGCGVPQLLHELAEHRDIRHVADTGLAIEFR